jgi:antirestriction protein
MISETKIYVADIVAYNNGVLHGVWIEDLLDLDEINQQVANMLSKSPVGYAEEYAIHDYEGFGELEIGEFVSLNRINQIAIFLNEYQDCGDVVLTYCNGDIGEANRLLEDCYQGIYDSIEDYAQEIFEECYSIPDPLKYYIDWNRLARDMLLNGDIHVVEKQSKLLIFST